MININEINKLIDQGLVQKKDFDSGLTSHIKQKQKVIITNSL